MDIQLVSIFSTTVSVLQMTTSVEYDFRLELL